MKKLDPLARLTHGHRRDGRRSPTYNSWRAAIARCYYPPHPYYQDYGGRGIRVCDRWRGRGGFARFLADMGERPEGLTLDRKDPDGDYEPANCRWADAKLQRWNRRSMAAPRCEYEPTVPAAGTVPAADMPF